MHRRPPKTKPLPPRPAAFDLTNFQERLVVHRVHPDDPFTFSEEQLRTGKVVLLLWPNTDGRIRFAVRYIRPVGDLKVIDAMVVEGLKRVFPSLVRHQYHFSISSEADRVLINLLERADV